MNQQAEISIEPESEISVRISFGQVIDELIFKRITAINQAIHLSPFPGFVESVPAYTTLTVFYDPMVVAKTSDNAGTNIFPLVIRYLENVLQDVRQLQPQQDKPPFLIPVCYGGRFGPDIEEVAAQSKLTVDDVIRLHTQTVYTVYLVGFLPGFPYLGGMNEKLATPRRLIPRKKVPAGSVGIAGLQTGVYPIDSPGGWQLIGLTPMRMFDIGADSPALLRAGDRVQFCRITASEFYELSPDL